MLRIWGIAPLVALVGAGLAVLSLLIVLDPNTAAAQTAKKLKCKGCVKSKQIKNGQIKNADLASNSVKGAKIADGAVTLTKLGNDVTALGLSGVAVVPAAAFQDLSSPARAGFNDFWWQALDTDTEVCLLAPVHLPDGVAISEFQAIVIDDSTTKNMTAVLERITPLALTSSGSTGDDSFKTLASVATDVPGAQAAAQLVSSTAISEPLVDAVENQYQVRTCFISDLVSDSNTLFLGARVFYN